MSRRVDRLAEAVRQRRTELGLRQADLAQLAGCSRRFVHTLEQGKSTLRLDKLLDVLEVLGPPEGKGREMLPISPAPRTMWSCYYEEGTLKDARRTFLFVYFDGDIFDGYFRVSSLPGDAATAF